MIVSALSCLLVVFVLAQSAAGRGDRRKLTLEFTAKIQSRVSLRLQDSQGYHRAEAFGRGPGPVAEHRLPGGAARSEVPDGADRLHEAAGAVGRGGQVPDRGPVHVRGRLRCGPGGVAAGCKTRTRITSTASSKPMISGSATRTSARGRSPSGSARQNLSWGETDIFRLLDVINPLDNTYGGIFEDLDDRRIPMWMLRGSYNFGYVGPASSLTLEGFWVPGNWDVRVAPIAPTGTPYAMPLAPAAAADPGGDAGQEDVQQPVGRAGCRGCCSIR